MSVWTQPDNIHTTLITTPPRSAVQYSAHFCGASLLRFAHVKCCPVILDAWGCIWAETINKCHCTSSICSPACPGCNGTTLCLIDDGMRFRSWAVPPPSPLPPPLTVSSLICWFLFHQSAEFSSFLLSCSLWWIHGGLGHVRSDCSCSLMRKHLHAER